MAAAGLGRRQVLEVLIEKGAEINTANQDGVTALMFAANGGHLEETKLLLEKGADANARRKDGATALVGAIGGGGHLEVIKVLVENGAECNTTVMGVSALRLAEMDGQSEVVEYLRSCGAE
jgi:ankyrin repeat protein